MPLNLRTESRRTTRDVTHRHGNSSNSASASFQPILKQGVVLKHVSDNTTRLWIRGAGLWDAKNLPTNKNQFPLGTWVELDMQALTKSMPLHLDRVFSNVPAVTTAQRGTLSMNITFAIFEDRFEKIKGAEVVLAYVKELGMVPLPRELFDSHNLKLNQFYYGQAYVPSDKSPQQEAIEKRFNTPWILRGHEDLRTKGNSRTIFRTSAKKLRHIYEEHIGLVVAERGADGWLKEAWGKQEDDDESKREKSDHSSTYLVYSYKLAEDRLIELSRCPVTERAGVKVGVWVKFFFIRDSFTPQAYGDFTTAAAANQSTVALMPTVLDDDRLPSVEPTEDGSPQHLYLTHSILVPKNLVPGGSYQTEGPLGGWLLDTNGVIEPDMAGSRVTVQTRLTVINPAAVAPARVKLSIERLRYWIEPEQPEQGQPHQQVPIGIASYHEPLTEGQPSSSQSSASRASSQPAATSHTHLCSASQLPWHLQPSPPATMPHPYSTLPSSSSSTKAPLPLAAQKNHLQPAAGLQALGQLTLVAPQPPSLPQQQPLPQTPSIPPHTSLPIQHIRLGDTGAVADLGGRGNNGTITAGLKTPSTGVGVTPAAKAKATTSAFSTVEGFPQQEQPERQPSGSRYTPIPVVKQQTPPLQQQSCSIPRGTISINRGGSSTSTLSSSSSTKTPSPPTAQQNHLMPTAGLQALDQFNLVNGMIGLVSSETYHDYRVTVEDSPGVELRLPKRIVWARREQVKLGDWLDLSEQYIGRERMVGNFCKLARGPYQTKVSVKDGLVCLLVEALVPYTFHPKNNPEVHGEFVGAVDVGQEVIEKIPAELKGTRITCGVTRRKSYKPRFDSLEKPWVLYDVY